MLDYSITEGYTLAGGMFLDGDFIPLYVRDFTGDVVYMDHAGVGMMIDEISIQNPIELPSEQALVKGLKDKMYGDCIGVIYGKEGAYVLLTESTAELRPFSNLRDRSETVFEIDMDIVDDVADNE